MRLENDKGQFVLPPIPANISPTLAQAIAEYRRGFEGSADMASQWDAAAEAIASYQPSSTADLAAKLIIAAHYHDPEIADDALAIEAPRGRADRLAVEMQLDSIDWLLADRSSADPALTVWQRFKVAFAAASASCRNGEPYHQQHPHGVACDEADDALPDTPATTVAGVESKLRRLFIQRNRYDWAEALALGADRPELRRELDRADVYDRMLWSAIDDLQHLGAEVLQ